VAHVALSGRHVLDLELPDPDSDTISTLEFLARLEEAWAVCDRFDLQTEIWRGRILVSVRDREKRGGEGRRPTRHTQPHTRVVAA
jgi:hypothetical protein